VPTGTTDTVWRITPHQHRGPAEQSGKNDHIYSPKLHNGAFKSTGLTTFMGAPYCPPDRHKIRAMGAKICFMAVPWDQGQIVRAGASQGAGGLREASTQYFPYMFEYDVDLLTFFNVVDCGDVPTVPGNNVKSQEYTVDYVTECLEGGAKVILFGGDHSLPIPGARALSKHIKDGKMGYLHVDAHLDAGPDWAGNLITNCSGASRALDLPNCSAKNMAHMCSRNGLNPKDWWDFYVDNDIRVVPMTEIVARGLEACATEIFDRVKKDTDAFYFTWDTDSIDISCMPGSTSPECFGLKARECIQLARIAGRYGCDILDIVELCPTFDIGQMSSKLAVNMIYHYLGSRAQTFRNQGKKP
jgi:agmatinase